MKILVELIRKIIMSKISFSNGHKRKATAPNIFKFGNN